MLNSCILIFILCFSISCKKEAKIEKPIYDRYGNITKECSVRVGDGNGPYEPLGRMSSRECNKVISKYCTKTKYKQIHRHKGHFARGKFGKKIMIGLCP